MNSTIKAILVVVLTLMVMGIVAQMASYAVNNGNGETSQANHETFKNSFISGCSHSAGADPVYNSESVCTCAYNQLELLYPDFSTNEDRMNRILQQGYNSTETDAVVVCVPQQ